MSKETKAQPTTLLIGLGVLVIISAVFAFSIIDGVIVVLMLGVVSISVLAQRFYRRAQSFESRLATSAKTQKKLEDRERHYRAIIEAMPGYVSWVDRSLKYNGVNEKMARDLRLTAQDFIGKEMGFTGTIWEENLKQQVVESFSEDWPVRQIDRVFEHDGVTRKHLSCIEKYDNNTHAVIVEIDTTHTWKLEQQVLRDRQNAIDASRLSSLGLMAGGIAHEVNNPLMLINATARKISRILHDSPALLEKVQGHLDTIEDTIFRINKIVNGLRIIARDGSHDPIVPTVVSNLLEEVIPLCNQKFKNHGIELILPEVPQNLAILCRAVQIGQVLVNLLNNAFDAIATHEQKWIKIDAVVNGTMVDIAVTDAGCGISEQVAQSIMTPFFTTKPIGKGTGLGLSIAKTIIDNHQGKLYYDKTCPNTRFVISLPRAEVVDGQNSAAA